MRSSSRGFTLIELIIVMAIISGLSTLIFAALNPAQRLRDARNTRRMSDVNAVLSAIHQSIVDGKGSLPTNLPATNVQAQLGTGAAGVCSPVSTGGCSVLAGQACVNLMTGTRNLTNYIASIPIDPSEGNFDATKTGYSVVIDSNGIITVRACGAEGTTISASR